MKKIAIVALLAAATAALTACDGADQGPEQRDEFAFDITQATAVSMDIAAGDIEVTESPRTGIRVVEVHHWHGGQADQPDGDHVVLAGALMLRYRCATAKPCSVDYRIEVPTGVRLMLTTRAGDVTLRAVSGPVEAVSGAGDILGEGLGGAPVSVDTADGDVALAFAGPAERIDVRAGAGDVTLRLAEGPYRLDVVAANGARDVRVPDDPTATRRVAVRAEAGDVTVTPA